jgi:hypothetical protein
VHLHQGDAERLTDLFSLDDADHLLTSTAIRTPQVRVARDGAVLPESAYTRGATLAGKPLTGLVDSRRLLRLFDDGATVVFQGMHRYWPPLAELVAELELELGHPCQANAYLTPPGSQGFAVHADSHDVFVFQTHGTKLWEVHHARGERPCGLHGEECRIDEVLLRPGLSMYLPTGTPHAARAQESASLHVTIGINQLTWRGVVRRSIDALLSEVDDEHLPAAWTERPGLLADGLAERLSALASSVTELDPHAAAQAEAERFLTGRNSRLRGGLHDVLAVESIAATSVLARRTGRPCVVTPLADDRLRVLIGDRSLDVPARLAGALDVVRASATFTPADLGLDPESNLVLARRLVREGLLEVRP